MTIQQEMNERMQHSINTAIPRIQDGNVNLKTKEKIIKYLLNKEIFEKKYKCGK